MSDTAYFVRSGPGRYRATPATGGAWTVAEQHISPLNGLLVDELQRAVPADDGLVLARIGLDILGPVGVDEVEVATAVVRPGRTVQLVEAEASWRGRAVLRARAWRTVRGDTAAVAGGAPPAMPGPAEATPIDLREIWPGGYIASIEARAVEPPRPGRGRVWIRTPLPLVADREPDPVARIVGLVDTANGIAVRRSPEEWAFPNVDLTIHLLREPRGPWLGLDTTVAFGATGLGITSSVLHDEDGPFGRAAQQLTLRPRV